MPLWQVCFGGQRKTRRILAPGRFPATFQDSQDGHRHHVHLAAPHAKKSKMDITVRVHLGILKILPQLTSQRARTAWYNGVVLLRAPSQEPQSWHGKTESHLVTSTALASESEGEETYFYQVTGTVFMKELPVPMGKASYARSWLVVSRRIPELRHFGLERRRS